jgi:hypothetical protein
MLKALKGITAVAVFVGPAFAYAEPYNASPFVFSARADKRASRDGEWSGPVVRPGYENQNGCQPGTHGVPFPSGNGFRCVLDGW